MNRREFLKMLALSAGASAALPAARFGVCPVSRHYRSRPLRQSASLAEHHGVSRNHLMKIVTTWAARVCWKPSVAVAVDCACRRPEPTAHRRRGACLGDRFPPGRMLRPRFQPVHAVSDLPLKGLVQRRLRLLLQGTRRDDSGRHRRARVGADNGACHVARGFSGDGAQKAFENPRPR